MGDTYYKNDKYPSMNRFNGWGNIGQLYDDKRANMMDKPWYGDLCTVLRENGDLEEFLKEKNAKIYYDYMNDHARSFVEDRKKYSETLQVAKEKLEKFDEEYRIACKFQNMVQDLKEAYPESKQMQLRQVLYSYTRDGEFNPNLVQMLFEQPSGLIDKLKYGGKISSANEKFRAFAGECKKLGIYDKLKDADRANEEIFYDAAHLNNGSHSLVKINRKSLEDTVNFNQSLFNSAQGGIETYEKSFQREIAPKIQKEDELIHQFAENLKTPQKIEQTEASKTFLQDIKDFHDDDMVFFNFYVYPKKRFETLMQEMGFSVGSATNQWHCVMNENASYKQPEVWSPVMTVKEAKEILPMIIDHMEAADIRHQAVIMPISSEKISDIQKGGNEIIPQFNFQQEMTDFLRRLPQSENTYTKDEVKKEFQGNSLFNGTMVSDDYFPWSKRAGRNGVVYAGIDLGYILQYDGARSNGTSGTTDFYIPTAIGKVEIGGDLADVTVGFVNVYHKSEGVDRFYKNFGMEDNEMAHLGRPEMDSETFVTPQKNPLKAKFLHVVIGGGREFFYKVPETPDPFVQYILDQRKGDVRNTFQFTKGYSPLTRLLHQADEIQNGTVVGSSKHESLSDIVQKHLHQEKETAEKLKGNKGLSTTETHMTNSEVAQETTANRPSEASMEETMGHRLSREKSYGSVIFGIQYPPHIINNEFNPNSVAYRDFLPRFFTEQKHFSSEEYQEKVAELFPRFKTKWYQKAPSEKDIENYFIEQYGYAAMDGATGVPMVEEKLGIKIGGGYKYPKGMSDIEYHAYTVGQIGLYTPFCEPNPKNQKEAYMEAWQELHYPREKILPILQQQYHELVELNPQLKDIQLDTNNPVHLTLFRAGVTYDFPVADINLFIAEHDKGERHRERMKKELDAIGLNEADFVWVLSSETIKNIGEKLQEKDKISAKETETPKVIEEKPTEQPKVEELPKTEEKPIAEPEKPKTPKEIVAEKLKAWGVEEGSYMIITPEDNLYTRYDGAEGPTARSVKGYFEDGVKDVAETGKEVVYGTNNGLCGAYFAEGVYVVSANTALRDALHYKGADVGFGVMLSNGEPFVKADASRDSETNADWANIRRVGEKISDERAEAYKARQKMMEEQRNATAADNVSQTLVRLCEFGDKYDTSGGLKENLALAYVSAPEQMTGVEFWGKIVQQYGDTAPEGRDKMVLEITQLGADVTKEIKGNEKNHSYTAVKKRCAESQNSEEMLKTARACSARSHSNASQYREAAYKS